MPSGHGSYGKASLSGDLPPEVPMKPVLTTLLALAVAGCATSRNAAPAATARGARLDVPIESHTLANGLRVVLSQDRSAPKVAVGVYYGIGFRVEPKDRTGF